MTNGKKFLLLAYLFVLFHTIKDFFQDFLETDFLYFFDANENLAALPQWGRVVQIQPHPRFPNEKYLQKHSPPIPALTLYYPRRGRSSL